MLLVLAATPVSYGPVGSLDMATGLLRRLVSAKKSVDPGGPVVFGRVANLPDDPSTTAVVR